MDIGSIKVPTFSKEIWWIQNMIKKTFFFKENSNKKN